VASFTPRRLYSQGKSPWYPLDRSLGGPQSRCATHEGVYKSFRTESKRNICLPLVLLVEKQHRVTATKLTRLFHKIAIQLHLVAESCTICNSRSRRPVRKLLDTPSYHDYFESQSLKAKMKNCTRWDRMQEVLEIFYDAYFPSI
jgi:hypothetical protein